jgi:hypothetical protein
LPFRNKHLASIGYLNPQKIALSKQSDIELIAKKLFVSDDNILKVTDEWKLLSMDQSRHSLSYKRVDHFWRDVFSQIASNDKEVSYSNRCTKMALRRTWIPEKENY